MSQPTFPVNLLPLLRLVLLSTTCELSLSVIIIHLNVDPGLLLASVAAERVSPLPLLTDRIYVSALVRANQVSATISLKPTSDGLILRWEVRPG
jgi:hypothetical protein